MRVSIECTYCGHIWTETVYNRDTLQDKRYNYGNCRHSILKVKDLSNKIDYYQGCPDFPPELADNGWPYSMGGLGNPFEGMD